MYKKSILCGASLALALSTIAHAQMMPGMPKLGKPAASGSSSEAAPAVDIDAFFKSADEAKDLVQSSVDHIFNATASKDDVDAINAERAAANAISNPNEKKAAQTKIDEAVLAKVNAMNFDETKKTLAAEKNQEKLKEVGYSVFNLVLGLLKDKDALVQGQALLSSIQSNPANAMKMASKIGRLKDVLGSMKSQVTNAPKLISGMQKLATVAKVTALPTSTSEKPKAVKAI